MASKSIQTTVSRNRSVKSVNPLACCVSGVFTKGLCGWLVHWFTSFRERHGGVLKFSCWAGGTVRWLENRFRRPFLGIGV